MKRIFVNVSRGMTDKTAVCVYPWEKAILEQIHGGEVEEVSIEEMCSLKGAIKVEKTKFKRELPDGAVLDVAPDMRAQLEAMIHVPEDEDPREDPDAEYGRLVDKYGPDKELPMPVVTVVYGRVESGAFAAALKEAGSGGSKPVEDMSINELRTKLRAEGIEFAPTAKKAELADLLATATA